MATTDGVTPEIQINVKGTIFRHHRSLCIADIGNPIIGPSELKLQISITTDKTVLELKQAIAAKSDVEAERQRLIYSGGLIYCQINEIFDVCLG